MPMETRKPSNGLVRFLPGERSRLAEAEGLALQP
jgi:hypothetical protein